MNRIVLGAALLFVVGSASAGADRRDAKRVNTITIPEDRLGAATRVDLFPDVHLNLVLERDTGSAGVVWKGTVSGVAGSTVTLGTEGGAMFGNIRAGSAWYQIRPDGNGKSVVVEMNERNLPDEYEGPAIIPRERHVMPLTAAAHDDGSVIDVLVVYTPKARNAAGGMAAMLNVINVAVSETNSAYLASGVRQRLRLAGTSEVTYNEDLVTGSDVYSTILHNLADPSDGLLDNVPSLRNQFSADLVTMLIEGTLDNCGIGYLANGDQRYGFNVVERTCAIGHYSFGHELGHNMGLDHDRANVTDFTSASRPYGYGYQDPDGVFRTIMAYSKGCTAPCPRIQRFSNPDVMYNGRTTGIAIGQASQADAAQALNDTALAVSNFRASTTTAGCGTSSLCLASSRFDVSLQARDQRTGNTGTGQPLPRNDLFGYFSLPALTGNAGNPEVFVKILDARTFDGKFWVFYGGLTDLEFTLTVTDRTTGRQQRYFKKADSYCGDADTSAFSATGVRLDGAPASLVLPLIDHGMTKTVDPTTYDPIGRTSTFSVTDERATHWYRVAPFSGTHTLQWRFYTPSGGLYFASDPTAFTGDGGTWSFWDAMYIAGHDAASITGQWRVDAYADGQFLVSDAFTINSNILAVCTPSDLCLFNHRFAVSLSARDQRSGRTAVGQPLPENDLFGYFSLPALTGDLQNPEVFVKILDGRAWTGKFWVFYGGLTDVELTINILDTITGVTKQYKKSPGSLCGGADTSAF